MFSFFSSTKGRSLFNINTHKNYNENYILKFRNKRSQNDFKFELNICEYVENGTFKETKDPKCNNEWPDAKHNMQIKRPSFL